MHPQRRNTMSHQGSSLVNHSSTRIPLTQIEPNVWEVPRDFQSGMKVPARIYADEDLLSKMRTDRTIQQCVNVAHLDGICKYAITMPDGHEGYGFPIGGVAATDYDEGLISPGGVGYDINCGVRLIRTNLSEEDVRPVLPKLVDTIFNFIPSGLGSRGQVKLSVTELDRAITDGLDWAVDHGYAWPEDPKTIEEEGCMEAADPSKVSNSAKSRGAPQLGSLGSGNHFIEIERADKIFDKRVAERLGIHKEGQILVLIHTGSRGYGHQTCSDYLRVMERAINKYNIKLPDRELAACPSKSPEAEDYIPAMSGHRYPSCQHGGVGRRSSRCIQGRRQSGRGQSPAGNRPKGCTDDSHRGRERVTDFTPKPPDPDVQWNVAGKSPPILF